MSSIFGNQQDIPETAQAVQEKEEPLRPTEDSPPNKDGRQSLESEGKIRRNFVKRSLGRHLHSSIPLIFRSCYEYDATINTLKLKQNSESEAKLQVYAPAASLIQSIKKPIAVVSICGRYRSGKSYFLSRMLGSHDAFSLGHTMHPCTFGIWMGTTVLECDDYVMLLLDTEGIDAVGTTGSSDAGILVMTILLSSYMVYNSLQVPTRGDLEKMSCFTELSKSISVRSGEENEDLTDFRLHFPDFLWLLRDVTLDTTDEISGKQITPTEYLKTKVLARSKKAVATVADNVVMCIRNYFPTIECKTLPPPTVNKAIMHNIAERANELSPEFVTCMEEVTDYVVHTAKVKKGFNNSTVVDGLLLSQLSHEYVEAVNSPNAIPTLDMTWQNVINNQLIAIIKELLRQYEKEMIKKLKQMYPLEVGRKDDGSLGATTLIGIHERVLAKRRKRFVTEMKTLLPINMNEKLTVKSFEARKADYLANLELQIVTYEEVVDDDGYTTERVADGILFKFIQKNYDESVTYCTKLFQELYEPIEKKIKEALNSSDDDIQYTFPHLQSDAEKMHDDYYRKARGPAKEFVFTEKKETILDRQLQVYETMVGFSKQVLKARQEAFEAVQQANEAKKRIDELERCIQQLEQKLLLEQPELDEVIKEQQRVIKGLERDLNQQIEEERERFEELSKATELRDKTSADASKQKIKEMEDISKIIIDAMKQEHEKKIGELAQDISSTKEKLEKFVAMYSQGETNPDRPDSTYVRDDKKGKKKKLFGLQLRKPESSKSKEMKPCKENKDSNEGETGETSSDQESIQRRRLCIIL